MPPVLRPLRSRHKILFGAISPIQRCQQGVRKEALSQWSCLSPSGRMQLFVGDEKKVWFSHLMKSLKFEALSEHLVVIEKLLAGCVPTAGWLDWSKGLRVLLPSQGSISHRISSIHSSRGKAGRGTPLKCGRLSWQLTPAVPSLYPLIGELFNYVQWTLAKQLKKQTVPENDMAGKIDKFAFACESRQGISCLNVTLESGLGEL